MFNICTLKSKERDIEIDYMRYYIEIICSRSKNKLQNMHLYEKYNYVSSIL